MSRGQIRSDDSDKILYHGNLISKYPTVSEFVDEIVDPAINSTQKDRIKRIFTREQIEDISQLSTYTIQSLNLIGLQKSSAKAILMQLRYLRQQSSLIMKADELEQIHSQYRYLKTGIPALDAIFSYSDGNIGLRSKSLIEIYGKSAAGKTQLMMTILVHALNDKINNPGHVLFIDTENSFDIHRLYEIAEYNGITRELIEKYLLVAKPQSFDQLEFVIENMAKDLREMDLSLLMIDSIIDPLRAQYPLGREFENLQERQEHLKKVTDQLKSLAMMHNIVVFFSNQVRADFDKSGSITPQGGHTLSHSSDVRLHLQSFDSSKLREYILNAIEMDEEGELITNYLENDPKWEWRGKLLGLEEKNTKISIIELVDAGYLSPEKRDIIIGRFGAIDASDYDKFIEIPEHSSSFTKIITEVRRKISKIETNSIHEVNQVDFEDILYR